MTYGGEKPFFFIEKAKVVSNIPGYGIVREIDGNPHPTRSEHVFDTHAEAAAVAAARLRSCLADIAIKYEETIAELESLV
jgi:hypothetical protein